MEFLIPIFITGFVFATFSWIAYVILEILRTRQRVQATSALQGKLIDRLGAQDVGMFLSSANGGQLLQALAQQPPDQAAHVRVLRALQTGLVFLAIGIGLFIYGSMRALPIEVEDGVVFVAILATAIGVGLLAAAGSSYVLSRRLGLLERGEAR